MLKSILLCLAAASVLSLVRPAQANDIEPSKEFYTATRAGGPITLDGDLTEWAGVPVLADPRFSVPKGSGDNGTLVLFEEYDGGTWTGPDDHTSAVQVVWDDENVYFGFVVTDEYHENAANSPWNGDSVQLMIANAARNTQIALYNYALGGVEDALGEVIVEHEAGPGGTEAVVTRNSETKRTIYEIKLPIAALGLESLEPGTQFGLGMAINDGDEDTPGQRGWGGLGAHSIVFGKTPQETALITLGTNLPGSDRVFFSAINPTLDSFTFRANDKGTSIVDPDTARLTIDGQAVTLTSADADGAVDFTYSPPQPFPPGSGHTYVIEIQDTLGNTVTEEGEFRTPNYALLTAADRVTPNTNERGFIFRVHQNDSFQATTIARALQQLAGILGQNFADRDAQSIAIGPGTAGANNRLPIEFEIAGVINMEELAAAAGDIVPDDTIPGIPGSSGDGLNGVAAEIITYIDLPAGRHTLIVNSDDGFQTTAGNINDLFDAQIAGEFNGGRGPADTPFTVFVEEAGVYPFRTVWYEGGGGSSIEWKVLLEDGTEVLLNDSENGGFTTYRSINTPLPTGIFVVSPLPGETGVSPNAAIFASIREGSGAVDVNSVRLSIDGAEVTATPERQGDLIIVNHQPAGVFASGSQHTASLTYSAGGTPRTESWTFTVVEYPTLTSAHQAESVNTSNPGFIWRVFQNEGFIHTTLAQTEQALAGEASANGEALPNLADPIAVGPALAEGETDGPLIRFEIPTVINMSEFGGTEFGNFGSDDAMPGIPGLNFSTDGIDAEIVTFIDLPAGLITMGVNSDDGFRTQAGYINNPEDGIILGEFDGGRGAADTLFTFLVAEAGVYPFRTIWQEGGGDSNIEWFTVDADGTKVLLNDRDNGGLPTYRTGVAPDRPSGGPGSGPVVVLVNGQVEITWTEAGAVLQESTDLQTWADVPGATSPYRPTVEGRSYVFYRLRQ